MSASEQPGEHRVSARTVVVWDALLPLLGDGLRDVVDIGGGTGGSAVRIAESGHRVSVVDPSPDALAALARRAQELGVDVAAHQGDVSSLLEVVAPDSADLVLCHGVLEMVADPVAALGAIHRVLRPGGTLSLLVGQRSAAVLARAMAGQFPQAQELLDDTSSLGHSGRRFTRAEAEGALAESGFVVTAVHGVCVFADLVPGGQYDTEFGGADDLVELERAVSRRPDFLPMATQLHLTARRG